MRVKLGSGKSRALRCWILAIVLLARVTSSLTLADPGGVDDLGDIRGVPDVLAVALPPVAANAEAALQLPDRKTQLELYVDGHLEATSSTFNPDDYDLGNCCPLRIGFGEVDYFSGKIREVRLYQRALDASEVAGLAAEKVHGM